MIVMPGRGLTTTRDYSARRTRDAGAGRRGSRATADQVFALLGDKTLDSHLNADAWWTNVPAKVWSTRFGGYQVIEKWLSYREQSVLGRPLEPDEVAYVSVMIRRIAAILLMGPALDANYRACASNAMTYEELGISRDAERERKDAKVRKRGVSKRLTPAMQPSRAKAKAAKTTA